MLQPGRRRALGWVARAVIFAAAVVGLRGDLPMPAPQVMGAGEVRTTPTELAGARSRRTAPQLRRLGLTPGRPVGRVGSSRELTLSLSADGSVATRRAAVVRSHVRVRGGDAPLQRSVATTEGQLLVAGLDARGRVRYSATVNDPLIVRAEFPGADGELHGETIELRSASVVVSVPDDPAIERVRIYRPDGDDIALVAEVRVR